MYLTPKLMQCKLVNVLSSLRTSCLKAFLTKADVSQSDVALQLD